MDINQLLTSITGTADARTKAIEEQTARMQANTAAIQNLRTVNVNEARAVADTAGTIAGQKAETDFIRNKALQEAATIFGMNADEQNFIAAQRMAEYTAAEDARKVARAEFDRLSSVGLLDNPVGYILAQLQLPQAAARNNALVAARDAAASDIATRQSLTASQKQVTTVNTADRVRTAALSEADNARRAAEIQLRQAEIENSSKLAGMDLQTFQLRDKAFDIQGDLFSKTLQVQQWKMQFESLQAQREAARQAAADRQAMNEERLLAVQERAISAKEREARLAAQEEQRQLERQQLLELNNGFATISKFLGLKTPMNVEIWKKIPNAKTKETWLQAAQNGTMGGDILDALKFINQVGEKQFISQTNPGVAIAVRGFEEGVAAATTNLQRDPINRTKKLKDLAEMGADDYMKLITSSAGNIKATQTLTAPQFDTLFNPYKANHKVMLQETASNPRLANNIVVKGLQAALIGANVEGQPNIPAEYEQKMLQSIIEQIRAKTLGVDDAARQVNAYYSEAARRNFDLYQYNLMGVPAQTMYVARIDTPGFMAEPVTADFMSFAGTKTALAAAARSGLGARTLEMFQGVPAVGPFMLPKSATIIENVLRGRE